MGCIADKRYTNNLIIFITKAPRIYSKGLLFLFYKSIIALNTNINTTATAKTPFPNLSDRYLNKNQIPIPIGPAANDINNVIISIQLKS